MKKICVDWWLYIVYSLAVLSKHVATVWVYFFFLFLKEIDFFVYNHIKENNFNQLFYPLRISEISDFFSFFEWTVFQKAYYDNTQGV